MDSPRTFARVDGRKRIKRSVAEVDLDEHRVVTDLLVKPYQSRPNRAVTTRRSAELRIRREGERAECPRRDVCTPGLHALDRRTVRAAISARSALKIATCQMDFEGATRQMGMRSATADEPGSFGRQAATTSESLRRLQGRADHGQALPPHMQARDLARSGLLDLVASRGLVDGTDGWVALGGAVERTWSGPVGGVDLAGPRDCLDDC